EFPAEDKFAHLPERSKASGRVSAFLTVQEGCDKFCTFCVVPYTRGAELSRTPTEIIAEAESLAATGVREITLLGQNVNAYHSERPHLVSCETAEAARGDSLHRQAALHDEPPA